MAEQTIVLNLDTKKFNRSMGLVKSALAGLATSAVLKGIVDVTARFEDLTDTLASVTGSAKAGQQAFANISKFATKTQFGIEELTNTYIKLAGAGIAPTEKLLTTFTDAAAVTTDQLGTLTSITDLFSRTVSGGLGIQELDRLNDRGLPVYTMLIEKLGLARGKVTEYGKSAEGAAKITKALTEAINEGFGGATASKLDNLSTLQSNFSIQLRNTANVIGRELSPALKEVIEDFTIFLGQNDKLAAQIGSGLGKTIKEAGDAVRFLAENFEIVRGVLFTILGGKLLTSVDIALRSLNRSAKASDGILLGMKKGLMGLIAPLRAVSAAALANPFTALAAGVILLGSYLVGANGLGRTMAQISAAFEYFGINLSAVGTYITTKFNQAMAWMKKYIDMAVDALVDMYNYLADIIPGMDNLEKAVRATGDYIVEKFESGTESVGSFLDHIKQAGVEYDKLNTKLKQSSVSPEVGAVTLGSEGNNSTGSTVTFGETETQKKNREKIEALEKTLRTEIEMEEAAYAERLKALEAFNNLFVNDSARYANLKERIESEHQRRMAAIAQQNFDNQLSKFKSGKYAEMDFSQFSEKEKTKFIIESGRESLQALGQHSKKAFQLMKAAAMAEAIINTAQGVTKALAQGGIFGPILAGIIIAAGAAQIATIASQNYQGRARGGSVNKGETYLTGEKGPELFMPNQSGTIIPNHNLGGTGTVNVNFEINAVDAAGVDQIIMQRKALITSIVREATENQGNRSFV